ncbi:trimethylamine methyltransferase family protein [Chloroflexota bacterium]
MEFTRSNFKAYATPQFRLLSDEQIHEIHLSALEVLEKTGVDVFNEEAIDLLVSAGGHVTDKERVRIPSHLVEDALKSAPKRVTLSSRDGQREVLLEGTKVYFGTGSDCPYILDSFTGERRLFTKKDVGQAALIADYLPNIDFFMSLGLVSDVPKATSDRHQFQAMILNTAKPIVYTAHDEAGMSDIIEMAAVAAGSREQLRSNPSIALYAEPSSPLQHSRKAVQKLLLAAQEMIPVIYTPCSIAGGTAPSTLAGALVINQAEVLSGLVMSQLKRKGAPFIVGGVNSILDMKTSIYSYGAPELHLLSAAEAEIAHYHRLPVFSTAGCSDAKVVDQQAAIEAAFSCLVAALSGANLVHDVGFLENGLIGSYEMLVMSNEIIAMAKRIMRGIEVNDDSLAVNVIDKVGPGGNFLLEEHTRRHFRSEHWRPELIDRTNYEKWKQDGKKTFVQRTTEKVKRILDEYQPEAVSPEKLKHIDAIVARAEEGKE